jgi:hypothetical protein
LGIREADIACRGVAAVSGFTGLKGGRCWLLWASASAQYLFSAGSSLQWVALSKSVNGAGSMVFLVLKVASCTAAWGSRLVGASHHALLGCRCSQCFGGNLVKGLWAAGGSSEKRPCTVSAVCGSGPSWPLCPSQCRGEWILLQVSGFCGFIRGACWSCIQPSRTWRSLGLQP